MHTKTIEFMFVMMTMVLMMRQIQSECCVYCVKMLCVAIYCQRIQFASATTRCKAKMTDSIEQYTNTHTHNAHIRASNSKLQTNHRGAALCHFDSLLFDIEFCGWWKFH